MRATLGRGFYADDQCSCLVVVVYTDNMIKSATSSAGKCTTLYCRAVVVYTDNMIKSATSDPLMPLFFIRTLGDRLLQAASGVLESHLLTETSSSQE